MRVILFRDKRTDNGERAYGVVTEDNHGEMVMAESPFEREEYNCCGANCLYVEWDGVCFTNRQTVEMDYLYESETTVCCEVIGNIHDNPELLRSDTE